MEPEGSLLHLEQPTTRPYPKPGQSTPLHHSHFLNFHLNINLPSKLGSSKWWWVGQQIIKLLIMQFSPIHSYLVPLRIKYSHQHPIVKQPQPTFLPQCRRPSFTPIQKEAKLEFCISQSLYFWKANWNTKDSAPNDKVHSVNSTCS